MANYTTQEEYVSCEAAVLNGQENRYKHLDYSSRDGILNQDFAYNNFMIVQIIVRVWNYDKDSNKNIKITRTPANINIETVNSNLTTTTANWATAESAKKFNRFKLGLINKSRAYSTSTRELNKLNHINLIKPLTKEAKSLKEFTTLDIETMDFCEAGLQIPLMVSFSHPSFAIKLLMVSQ